MTDTLPSTPASPALLDVRGLIKRFPIGGMFHTRQVHAVEDVSMAVSRGEAVAVVGESGSGKSTTVRLIARLMPVTSGEIFFEGADVLKSEPKSASLAYRRKVQMIFQDPFSSLNSVHTIAHHLERPLVIHKLAGNRAELEERIHALLAEVGLNPAAEIAARYPHQLSGGQRQRVAIARALAVGPQLILADEPISMLDVSIRIGVLNLMAELKEQRGIAMVYITHDLASARYIGDRILVMYAGHAVEGGPSEAILSAPAHPYTRLLLSAVPDPRAGLRTASDPGLHGEVPSQVDPRPGCPFAARCPQVLPRCREGMPGVTQVEDRHWARCHLYG